MPDFEASGDSVSALRLLAVRACGTCVKAKVKCVPSVDGRKCQRCNRLDKLCQAATPSSRKRPQSSNVIQLEQKLDRLVTLFAASKSKSETPQTLEGASISSSVSPSALPQTYLPSPSKAVPHVSHQNPEPQASWHKTNLMAKFCLGLEPYEAAFLLIEYRTQMEPQFPFVVIPPEATAEKLRQDRPMLWGAIMTAASYHNPARQEALGWKMIEEFSTRILLKAEKSLDLLQGLLVHLSWYHYHSAINPQFMNLLSLAKSMVMSLGYHRTRTVKDRTVFLVDGPDGLSTPCLPTIAPLDVRKFEEWRALAGCFFLASMTASSCRRADPLPFTKNLEEGCKVLFDRQEYPGDRIISCLVSIQNVVVKSNGVFNDADTGMGTVAPIRMHASALKSELDRIMSGIPADLRQDMNIISCSQIAEISLHEYSLYNSLNISNDKAQRLNVLYACLVAVQAYIDHHIATTSVVFASQSYSHWVFSSYALLMAIKLCACKAEGWDFQHARDMLRFPEVTDILLSKMEALVLLRNESAKPSTSLEELGKASDVFVRYLRHARYLKLWYEPMLKRTANDSQAPPMDKGFSEVTTSTMTDGVSDNTLPMQNELYMDTDDSLWQLYDASADWMMMGI